VRLRRGDQHKTWTVSSTPKDFEQGRLDALMDLRRTLRRDFDLDIGSTQSIPLQDVVYVGNVFDEDDQDSRHDAEWTAFAKRLIELDSTLDEEWPSGAGPKARRTRETHKHQAEDQ
jgi:hypothetical protein